MIDLTKLPNLQGLSTESIAKFVIACIKENTPKSSTKLSLQPEGYPANGEIETTIRNYQTRCTGLETGYHALATGCGNCQDMAYAGALILRAAGYKGKIAIGEFGINHRFLFVDNMIVDPWSETYCPDNNWKDSLTAYGGSVKEGIMRGKIFSSSHEELEDETPEVIELIPMDIDNLLKKYNVKKHTVTSSLFQDPQGELEQTSNTQTKANAQMSSAQPKNDKKSNSPFS